MSGAIPDNLLRLHGFEEQLRERAEMLIAGDARLELHLALVEKTMNLADLLRQFPTADEDIKVLQALGMRLFNAFGSALKLALSGYCQNAALIMRDVLETVFLLDLFRGDRSAIPRWRFAEKKDRMRKFSPVKVRSALEKRDGPKSNRVLRCTSCFLSWPHTRP